jgi:hypothetical protein
MPAISQLLRDAFMRTDEGPPRPQDAKKIGLSVSVSSGEDCAKLIERAAGCRRRR